MAKGFAYKWMRTNELVISAERNKKGIMFKISIDLLENGLSKSKFWVVSRVDDGFLIRPFKKVLK